MIVCHPKWLERYGAGDIVRYLSMRGFQVTNPTGSRFLHIEEPPPVRPPPSNPFNFLCRRG